MSLYFNPRRAMLFILIVILLQFQFACTSQQSFPDPNQAVTSLVDSLRADDDQKLMKILGPSAAELIYSGDPNVDDATVKRFLDAYDQKHQLVTNADGSITVSVGNDDWPLPIPLVKDDSKGTWAFDTEAGKDELLNRRIGRDELDTIQTCLAVVDAQKEYAILDPQKLGIPSYAQKFLSDPGKKNGLYYETAPGEPQSPLGDLVGTAAEQGYKISHDAGPHPYHGYIYRMIKSQGPDAPGGARDYMLGDNMIGGFAVVAYPANYGNTGIMTFIVNHDGDVYQKDLGPDTRKAADKITAYNPDSGWKKIADSNSDDVDNPQVKTDNPQVK